MECPFCGSQDHEVRETRRGSNRITRRRRCSDCQRYFKTSEEIAEINIRVRKSDGHVEAFDMDKVRVGIERAALHSDDLEDVDALLGRVLRRAVGAAQDRVVASGDIGTIVFEELRAEHPVSAVRYALVLHGRTDREGKGWKDANAFRAWLPTVFPAVRTNRAPVDLTTVVKRDLSRENFDRDKLENSIGLAAKGRFGGEEGVHELATRVADSVLEALGDQPLVTTGQISAEILRALRANDHIAFLRFASTAKVYRDIDDYETEAIALRNL